MIKKFFLITLLISAAGHAAEFLNLLEQDFDARPELRRFLPAINNMVQILTPVNLDKPSSNNYASIPAEETPNDIPYRLGCSGSFIGSKYIATATHCYWRRGIAITERWILRNHRFEIIEGKLVRTGYDDYFVYPKVITQNSDTVILEISGQKANTKFNFSTYPQVLNDKSKFHLMGFPNHLYATPFLSYNCAKIGSRQNSFNTNCQLKGGMSGGPQIHNDLTHQVAVNCSSQEKPVGVHRTMSYPIIIPSKI